MKRQAVLPLLFTAAALGALFAFIAIAQAHPLNSNLSCTMRPSGKLKCRAGDGDGIKRIVVYNANTGAKESTHKGDCKNKRKFSIPALHGGASGHPHHFKIVDCQRPKTRDWWRVDQFAAQLIGPASSRPAAAPFAADYGDAPENDEKLFTGGNNCNGVVTNYPSRLNSNGPYHTAFNDVWLGSHPNTETAEADAILLNCDDWIQPPFDMDDGCVLLLIGPTSGWACVPGGGGGVFGPYPGTGATSCELAQWTFRASVGAGAANVPRFANVVVDARCPGPNGFYGDTPPPEWVLVNAAVPHTPGGSTLMATTLPFFVEVACGDVGAGGANCTNGFDDDNDGEIDEWGILAFWTRFMVTRQQIDPALFAPLGWDGRGQAGGFVYGETEDWLVFGDPGGAPPPSPTPTPTTTSTP
jgi:hypothetical protein